MASKAQQRRQLAEAKEIIAISPCPRCHSPIGKRCTARLITGKVCQWDRRVPVDYVHKERKATPRKETPNGQ